MQALILCGGLGTRLREVVPDRPKSLALIGNEPFLLLLLRHLKSLGISEIILASGHLAGQIEESFGVGKQLGLDIRHSKEPTPLGTAGAVKLAEPMLRDRFFILNGDTWVDFLPRAMETLMLERKTDLVMALRQVENTSRYGRVDIGPDGRLLGFREKGLMGPGFINAGVYLAHRGMLGGIPAGKAVSLEREIFPTLLNKGIYGCITSGRFIDIGVPEDYRAAQDLFGKDEHVGKGP